LNELPTAATRPKGLTEERTISRPALHENGLITEAVQNDLILRVEHIMEKAVEGAAGRSDLFTGHAAAPP
jgi:hypothetical protein